MAWLDDGLGDVFHGIESLDSDTLLSWLAFEPVKAIGYLDDIMLVSTGINVKIIESNFRQH